MMRVDATDGARDAIRRVAATGREDLVLVLGTGCCDSTAPYLYDRYYPGHDAVLVGAVEGVPVFAHGWLADLYAEGEGLQLDCREDVLSDSFSLESELGCRLTLRIAIPQEGRAAAG
jgi:uncharacterized protein (DUF779 family)